MLLIIIIVFVIICIAAIVSGAQQDAKEKEKLQTAVSTIRQSSFIETSVIKDAEAGFYLSIDDIHNEVFCYSNSKQVKFKYADIISAEIKENDVIVSNKSASLGGAIAGGLLAGGVGAVVGSSSMGKTTSTKEITTLNVHITLRNNSVRSFDVYCRRPLEKYPYKESYNNAQKIFDFLIVAMDKVTVKTDSPKVAATSKTSVGELKELVDLKHQGLITDEEFATMKSKIINK